MLRRKRLFALLVMAVVVASLLVPVAGGAQPDPEYRFQLSRFTEVFNLIILGYVDPVNLRALVDGAIAGMLESLGDPYSDYFTPEELRRFTEGMEGTYGGLGMSITTEEGAPVVLQVFPGTPAERAGIKAGDILLEADGEGLIGMPLDKVTARLRGEPGTAVTLLIKRVGVGQPFTVRLVRELIRLVTVESRMLEPGIGYLKIGAFHATTGKETREALASLGALRGLVLDLRDNTGGYLEQAVEVASLFLPEGPVVRIRRRGGASEFLHGHGRGINYPLAVLVNHRTASASEIVAGAIQDYRVGVLVGTRTFGKGTVQTLYPLMDSGGLKLTTARYFTPTGRSIHGIGLEPDHVVEALYDPAKLPIVAVQLLKHERTLREGMVGLDVQALQRRLGQLGLYTGEEHGVFDAATTQAVREFQRSAGLPVTGEVDAKTVDELNLARTPRPEGPPPPDVQLEKALEVIKGKIR